MEDPGLSAQRPPAKRKWFALPPWLKRTTAADQEAGQSLVVRQPPPVAIDLAAAEVPDGWTREELVAYQAERDTSAMAIVAASMDRLRRPSRPRWANNRYRPAMWWG
jgi:hypothetical protein